MSSIGSISWLPGVREGAARHRQPCRAGHRLAGRYLSAAEDGHDHRILNDVLCGRDDLRLPRGGAIDRLAPIPFRFNGVEYQGYRGDTLASGLLANGVRLVGRSFKYHRPRGVDGRLQSPTPWSNCAAARREPNGRAATVSLPGLGNSQNCWPHVGVDLLSVNQIAGPLFAAGFITRPLWAPVCRPGCLRRWIRAPLAWGGRRRWPIPIATSAPTPLRPSSRRRRAGRIDGGGNGGGRRSQGDFTG